MIILPKMFAGGLGGRPNPNFVDEDRARDWHCPSCRERNFAKRPECFKCRAPRPNDAVQIHKPPPKDGTTLNGMVKSYNKKGFGFIMCTNHEDPESDWAQDIYYLRDSVSSRLLHPDMPGEHVTFELFREGRRVVARNIRPLGESLADSRRPAPQNASSRGFAATYSSQKTYKPGEEDRTHDWLCPNCGERNFVKRFECFRCKTPRPVNPTTQGFSDAPPAPSAQKRSFSPHAGARAIRDSLAKARAAARDKESESSSSRRKRRKKTKKKSSSSSSSSSPSEKKKKSKKKDKKKKKKRSSSSSSKKSSDASSDCKVDESASVAPQSSGNPDIDQAKSDALEKLMKLRSVEPKETRMSEWRALLREWHPDKNPERQEVATAVFQFLQKGKQLLDQAG